MKDKNCLLLYINLMFLFIITIVIYFNNGDENDYDVVFVEDFDDIK